MEFDRVSAIVDGVPHMTLQQGRTIYDFIRREQPQRVLELGFASGVSTCYMAAALEEVGDAGRVVTVDIPDAVLHRDPTVYDLLERTGLGDRVDVRVDPTTYTWELKRMLEQPEPPQFDFVFIDGAHTWDVDALAFLLVDPLLAPGGWVLFDDLEWTLAGSPSMARLDWVLELPVDRQRSQQVRAVVDLLVRTRGYDQVIEKDGWAWAHKAPVAPAVHAPEPPVHAPEPPAPEPHAPEPPAPDPRHVAEVLALTAERDAARAESARSAREVRLWRGRYERLRGRLPIRAAARVAGPLRAVLHRTR